MLRLSKEEAAALKRAATLTQLALPDVAEDVSIPSNTSGVIRLTLPMSTSTNALYGARKGGGKCLSDHARAFREQVALIWSISGYAMLEGELRMCVELYLPRMADVDNWQKDLQDSLQGWAYQNDMQIGSFCVERYIDKDNPRIELVIEARWTPQERALLPPHKNPGRLPKRKGERG